MTSSCRELNVRKNSRHHPYLCAIILSFTRCNCVEKVAMQMMSPRDQKCCTYDHGKNTVSQSLPPHGHTLQLTRQSHRGRSRASILLPTMSSALGLCSILLVNYSSNIASKRLVGIPYQTLFRLTYHLSSLLKS